MKPSFGEVATRSSFTPMMVPCSNRIAGEKEEVAAHREESPEVKISQKEEIHVAADHASKMAAKWEKIQKKEAKKAEKSKMPQKGAAHTVSSSIFFII